jgi:hypothetical protein
LRLIYPTVLADLAEGAGIERSRASAFLSEPASFDAVIDDEKLTRGLGLNGVPSFVLGGNYLFSGAQPTSVMVRALREASAILISTGQVAAPAEPATHRQLSHRQRLKLKFSPTSPAGVQQAHSNC